MVGLKPTGDLAGVQLLILRTVAVKWYKTLFDTWEDNVYLWPIVTRRSRGDVRRINHLLMKRCMPWYYQIRMDFKRWRTKQAACLMLLQVENVQISIANSLVKAGSDYLIIKQLPQERQSHYYLIFRQRSGQLTVYMNLRRDKDKVN